MAETHMSSYEEIPYESKPLYPTHPDCVGTVATLFGLTPAPVDGCRVLELGCATGGNLIPMALSLPKSQFLGIDLSPSQIAVGQKVVAALALPNIEFQARSILDVDASFGTFDYIICHGVYSWVPPVVQDKILSICQENLTPNGIAYISYNTYPGWHTRRLIRDVMGYHSRQFADPNTRISEARAFLNFLIDAIPVQEGNYHRTLKQEVENLRNLADSYIFHEHLEDENHPAYFHQFMERAAAKSLQYVGDAWTHTRMDDLKPEVVETLQNLAGDIVQLEQYMDFLRNRTFRRSLLCHDRLTITRELSLGIMRNMHLTALAKPKSPEPEVLTAKVEEFAGDDGRTVASNIPLIKSALINLYRAWPRALSFAELWERMRSELSQDASIPAGLFEKGPEILANAMGQCYMNKLVALHVHPPRMVLELSEKPKATSLARYQAHAGQKHLANLRHRLVQLSDFDCALVQLLDGERDRPALIDGLTRLVQEDYLAVQRGDQPLKEEPAIRAALAEALEPALLRIANSSLLIG